jgi:hypothetical protein
VNARAGPLGIIGAEVGFVATLVLFQYVYVGGPVEQILGLVAGTFLGWSIPRRVLES